MLYQCCENVLFRKLNIWGLDFFRLKVPQSPLQLVGPIIMSIDQMRLEASSPNAQAVNIMHALI